MLPLYVQSFCVKLDGIFSVLDAEPLNLAATVNLPFFPGFPSQTNWSSKAWRPFGLFPCKALQERGSRRPCTKKAQRKALSFNLLAEREDFEPVTLTAYATISYIPKFQIGNETVTIFIVHNVRYWPLFVCLTSGFKDTALLWTMQIIENKASKVSARCKLYIDILAPCTKNWFVVLYIALLTNE